MKTESDRLRLLSRWLELRPGIDSYELANLVFPESRGKGARVKLSAFLKGAAASLVELEATAKAENRWRVFPAGYQKKPLFSSVQHPETVTPKKETKRTPMQKVPYLECESATHSQLRQALIELQEKCDRLEFEFRNIQSERDRLADELREARQDASSTREIIDFIKADIAHYSASLRQIDEQKLQLESDRAQILQNLYAAQRYLFSLTGDDPPPGIEMIGNSKRMGAV